MLNSKQFKGFLLMKIKFIPMFFISLTSLVGCKNNSFTKALIPFLNEKCNTEFTTEVLTFNDAGPVTYVSLNDAFKTTKYIQAKYLNAPGYNYSINYDNALVTLNNGVTIKYDVNNETITISDHFLAVWYKETFLSDYPDVKEYDSNEINFIAKSNLGNYRYKNSVETIISLKKYGFDIKKENNKIYIPFQIHNDIFNSASGFACTLLKNIMYCCEADTTNLKELIKENALDITPEILDYNYRETCFNLDLNYGLKNEHFIDSFDESLTANGHRRKMLESVEGYQDALSYFIAYNLDDIHSSFNESSPSAAKDFTRYVGPCHAAELKTSIELMLSRPEFDAYEKYDDTAFITFGRFKSLNEESYIIPEQMPDEFDTQNLFTYSYKKISEDSEIKNVIIDMSLNAGGDARCLCYLMGMLTGNTSSLAIRDTVDNSILVDNFVSDANLDHKYDINDKLFANKRIYILTSESSFSCGNALPCFLHDNMNVTICGKRSGGGACNVISCSNVIGSVYSISSPLKLSVAYNGTFYSIDRGIDPDINIEYKDFYNRPKLLTILGL